MQVERPGSPHLALCRAREWSARSASDLELAAGFRIPGRSDPDFV